MQVGDRWPADAPLSALTPPTSQSMSSLSCRYRSTLSREGMASCRSTTSFRVDPLLRDQLAEGLNSLQKSFV